MELQLQEEKRIQAKYPGLLDALRVADPISLADAVDVMLRNGVSPATIAEEAAAIYCCAAWRENRVIYHFNNALATELLEQTNRISDDEQLPCELLRNLPFDCIAVEFPPFRSTMKGEDEQGGDFVLGFTGRGYIFYEPPSNSIWKSGFCCLWEAPNGDMYNFYAPIDGCETIQETITAIQKEMSPAGQEMSEMDARAQVLPVLAAMQIVLYLQAQNADIQKPPQTKKKKKGKKKKAAPRTQTAPPEIVRIGYRVGRALREYRQSERAPTSTGKSKRPHSRRGHWHSFWTGPKSKPELRRLIVRWVAPMMIHRDNENKTTTIYNVTGDGKK